ncbi:hypothetical protein [Flavonifractor plautii]|uniref:hypothetical protein n=1 Tax=Flavonifractor plautii TaxID=292800 RepID=UPI003D7CAAED
MALIVNGKKVAGVGLPGKDGAPGADGKDGAPGKSAYQAAKEKGYTRTEEEFNTALAGMQSAPFLPLAGGIMQGPLSLSGNPTEGNHAANKQYVDEHAGSRVILGSYVGTGKSGESNPNQITLAEPFKILCIYGRQHTDSYESVDASGSDSVSNIIPSSIIPTEYTRGFGFFYSNNSRDSYGKKSADGKTFSWYFGLSPIGAADVQFNTSGVVYHYYAIV